MNEPIDGLKRTLGEHPGVILLQSSTENRDICAHMLSQARRELCLLSRHLDKPVFDQSAFIIGLKDLALRSRLSRIRILLQDHEPVVKRGHRILELARRLSSSMEIRMPNEDWIEYAENFMLVDQYGYVHRELATRYTASADFHAPLQVQRLRTRFDEIWESAQPDSELRRLYL